MDIILNLLSGAAMIIAGAWLIYQSFENKTRFLLTLLWTLLLLSIPVFLLSIAKAVTLSQPFTDILVYILWCIAAILAAIRIGLIILE